MGSGVLDLGVWHGEKTLHSSLEPLQLRYLFSITAAAGGSYASSFLISTFPTSLNVDPSVKDFCPDSLHLIIQVDCSIF